MPDTSFSMRLDDIKRLGKSTTLEFTYPFKYEPDMIMCEYTYHPCMKDIETICDIIGKKFDMPAGSLFRFYSYHLLDVERDRELDHLLSKQEFSYAYSECYEAFKDKAFAEFKMVFDESVGDDKFDYYEMIEI